MVLWCFGVGRDGRQFSVDMRFLMRRRCCCSSILIASLGLKVDGVVDRLLVKMNSSPDSPGSRDKLFSDSADKPWVPELCAGHKIDIR